MTSNKDLHLTAKLHKTGTSGREQVRQDEGDAMALHRQWLGLTLDELHRTMTFWLEGRNASLGSRAAQEGQHQSCSVQRSQQKGSPPEQ